MRAGWPPLLLAVSRTITEPRHGLYAMKTTLEYIQITIFSEKTEDVGRAVGSRQ